MTALRARCWGVIRSELYIDHLLEERREVGADTGLPRGGESIPELGWVTGQSTSHCSAIEISSVTACEVSLVNGADAGGASNRLVATGGRRSTMVSR
jgi:hypothetical protein